jgi:acetyl esterase
MPLDPDVHAVLAALATQPEFELTDATVGDLRANYDMMGGLGAGEPPAIASAVDADADGVPVRIYTPLGDGPFPVVVFLHGGGWTIGSVAGYDALTRKLAAATGAIVVSVDYRLAPEHPHPAAVDDSWTALEWTAKHAVDFGGDAARLAVAGDSAGGNLSAVLAVMARDRGGPRLALQALVYPAVDHDFTRPSFQENGTGYFLELSTMEYFWAAYTRAGSDPDSPLMSPLYTPDLRGVAPALVITAEFDPLRDEGEAYAERLRAAGVPVEATRFDGTIHGFVAMPAMFASGKRGFDQLVAALVRALSGAR